MARDIARIRPVHFVTRPARAVECLAGADARGCLVAGVLAGERVAGPALGWGVVVCGGIGWEGGGEGEGGGEEEERGEGFGEHAVGCIQ